jgi:hypothetical protein
VSKAHSPHAVSFLQPAAGSQLKAGGVPPQVQRFVRGLERARVEVVRRMAMESFMLEWRICRWNKEGGGFSGIGEV